MLWRHFIGVLLLKELTYKQQRFVEEYLVDLCAGPAVERAGYDVSNPASANALGYRMLRIPEIEEQIKVEMDKRSRRTQVTADRVLRELALIAFSNLGDYVVPDEDGNPVFDFLGITRDQLAALSEMTIDSEPVRLTKAGMKAAEGQVTATETQEVWKISRRIKFKLHDKAGALRDCARHLGLMKEKVEVAGIDGEPIKVETKATIDASKLTDEQLRALSSILIPAS